MLFIKNFIKYNHSAIEQLISDFTKAERFSTGDSIDAAIAAPIKMLTKVLVEGTDFDPAFAEPVVCKTILITLLNEWLTDFKKANKKFCNSADIGDKYACIQSFENLNYKNYTRSKLSFFIFLYDIKPDFDIDFSSLCAMKKEFDALYRSVLAENSTQRKDRLEKAKYDDFKDTLSTYVEPERIIDTRRTIDDIDLMDRAEFEQYIATLFTKMGYTTEVTQQSNEGHRHHRPKKRHKHRHTSQTLFQHSQQQNRARSRKRKGLLPA